MCVCVCVGVCVPFVCVFACAFVLFVDTIRPTVCMFVCCLCVTCMYYMYTRVLLPSVHRDQIT